MTAERKCPRDGTALPAAAAGELRCAACSGVLIESAEMAAKVVANGFNTDNVVQPWFRTHLPCPGCKAEMDRFLLNLIELDVCKTCGLSWFDPGESEKMIAYLNSERISHGKTSASLDDFGVIGHALGEMLSGLSGRP